MGDSVYVRGSEEEGCQGLGDGKKDLAILALFYPHKCSAKTTLAACGLATQHVGHTWKAATVSLYGPDLPAFPLCELKLGDARKKPNEMRTRNANVAGKVMRT